MQFNSIQFNTAIYMRQLIIITLAMDGKNMLH